MIGTISGTVNIYKSSPGPVFQAQAGDRITYTVAGATIINFSKLTRNGVVKLEAGPYYVNAAYVTPDVEPPPPPPPPNTVTLKHTIQVYSDGSITIDGNPYP